MAGKRCAHEGCRAWAMRGQESCRAHQATATAPRPEAVTQDEAEREERARRVAAFKRRIERGDYRGLLEEALAEIIDQGGREGALTEEIGALRLVMKTLLNTDLEQHAEELSVSIPRVVNATVRALKTQRAISGQTAGDLTEALTRVLLEMGLGE